MSRRLGGGAVFVSMMPSVPDTGVEKVSLVIVEAHLVRANSTPLGNKEFFSICASGLRTSMAPSD